MTTVSVMTPGVATIAPYATVAQAAQALEDSDGPLLAVWAGGRVLGLVTAQGVADFLASDDSRADEATVEEIMTSGPVLCHPDADLKDTARQMLASHLRRILVVDAAGVPVGTITLDAIAYALATATLPASNVSLGEGI